MERSEIMLASLKTPIEGKKAIMSGSSLAVKIGQ